MLRILTATTAIGLGLTCAVLPAMAQDQGQSASSAEVGPQDTGGEKINQLIVYGNDPCPVSKGDEITVCARKAESERYRIPKPLRGIDSPQSEAWTNRVAAYETVGNFGTLSCSPVGAGGSTGCTQKLIDQAYAQKKNGSDVQFSELINEERQKRLSTIDSKAAAQQKRVDAAEKAYFDQQKNRPANEDAAEAAAAADNAALPTTPTDEGTSGGH